MDRRVLWLCFAVLGCGSTQKGADTGLSGTYPLDAAMALEVGEDGSVALMQGSRRLWALPAGVGPQARSVEETVEAALGMWRFERVSEDAVIYDVLEDVEVSSGTATLTFAPQTGAGTATLTVTSSTDSTVLSLSVDGGADDANALAVPAACDADGAFFGWGEQYTHVDRTGEQFPLFVSEQGIGRTGESWSFTGDLDTTYFAMPWYIDPRGFGVLYDTDHRTNVDLCATDEAVAWVEVMSAEPLSFTVLHGPTPLDVTGQLGELVGRPKMPPEWAFSGAWMCAQGGTEVVDQLVADIEAAGIPATTLWVQDWTGRRENPGGGYGVQYRWVPDEEELYPDIAEYFAGLKARGYRIVGYVNPFVDPILDHWDDLEAGGMLPVHPETGETYTFVGPRGSMTTADLTNPATRDYIKDHLRAAVDDVGLDGWMADFAEWQPIDAVLFDGSDAAATHNRYPELWQSLTREVMDELRPDGDWLMFARSGWTGVQSVAMVHWAGDQEADWEHTDGIPTVVPAMLSMSLSGQPYVTHDVAGFSGGPSTKELYLRWTELGALSPFLRTHDGNERDRNWRWDADAETTAHFAAMARLHAALAPELIALGEGAARGEGPIVRHTMLIDPDDRETWGLNDQYLLGDDLLVAPVLEEGVTSRTLYLPSGTWVHVWSGTSHSGPGSVTVDAPVGQPPLFSRDVDRPDLRSAVEAP